MSKWICLVMYKIKKILRKIIPRGCVFVEVSSSTIYGIHDNIIKTTPCSA